MATNVSVVVKNNSVEKALSIFKRKNIKAKLRFKKILAEMD